VSQQAAAALVDAQAEYRIAEVALARATGKQYEYAHSCSAKGPDIK
jgi:outer membrane protein TolC